MNRKVLLGGVIAVILVVSLVVGIYALPHQGTSSTGTQTQSSISSSFPSSSSSSSLSSSSFSSSSTSSSSSSASSTVAGDPLASFGKQIATVPVGAAPYGAAYDPVTGDIFVAVSGADTVAVVDIKDKVVANISLGAAADFLAYDPSDSLLYAPLIGQNSIVIISMTSDAVISTVATGTSPGWVAYDPASQTIYSVNRETNVVAVISGTEVVENITVQGLPFALAYDPFDHDMYLTNNVGMVFVINGTSNSVLETLQAGGASSNLLGIAYNPSDHRMYATSYSDGKVYILNGSQLAGSIAGFDEPIGIAFGTSDNSSTSSAVMYVVNSGNETVSAWLSGRASTVPVGSSPREVVFEPSTGAIAVTEYGGTTLSVISA